MSEGLLLLLGTGSCWAGLAAVVAIGSTRQAPAALVQPFSALLVLVFAGWSAFAFGAIPSFGVSILFQAGTLLAAGMCNYFMLNLVQRGMEAGRAGVVWAFTQSSMICPFLLGIIVFKEPGGIFRLGGIMLILLGLILFACARKEVGTTGAWLPPTLCAFVLAGSAQCFASLPSYFQLEGMTALRRMMLTQCGILIAFGLDYCLRPRLVAAGRNVWFFAGIFGFLNLAALLLFYNGLNLLADARCASAGYPTAQGLSIALFFLIGQRKKSTGVLSWAAFFLLLTGIVFLVVETY